MVFVQWCSVWNRNDGRWKENLAPQVFLRVPAQSQCLSPYIKGERWGANLIPVESHLRKMVVVVFLSPSWKKNHLKRWQAWFTVSLTRTETLYRQCLLCKPHSPCLAADVSLIIADKGYYGSASHTVFFRWFPQFGTAVVPQTNMYKLWIHLIFGMVVGFYIIYLYYHYSICIQGNKIAFSIIPLIYSRTKCQTPPGLCHSPYLSLWQYPNSLSLGELFMFVFAFILQWCLCILLPQNQTTLGSMIWVSQNQLYNRVYNTQISPHRTNSFGKNFHCVSLVRERVNYWP